MRVGAGELRKAVEAMDPHESTETEPPPRRESGSPSSELVLLIDFGSTYTKVAAVDLEREQLVGRSRAATTVKTDINIGLRRALDRLQADVSRGPLLFKHRFACSSAQGGLRMIAVGLVPELRVPERALLTPGRARRHVRFGKRVSIRSNRKACGGRSTN